MGHGALVYSQQPLELAGEAFDVIVTGPRRSMFIKGSEKGNHESLRPYYAVPFGDMMIAGCFGLLAATAEVLPDLREVVQASMQGLGGLSTAPWDVD
jgi:hypothetical protein